MQPTNGLAGSHAARGHLSGIGCQLFCPRGGSRERGYQEAYLEHRIIIPPTPGRQVIDMAMWMQFLRDDRSENATPAGCEVYETPAEIFGGAVICMMMSEVPILRMCIRRSVPTLRKRSIPSRLNIGIGLRRSIDPRFPQFTGSLFSVTLLRCDVCTELYVCLGPVRYRTRSLASACDRICVYPLIIIKLNPSGCTDHRVENKKTEKRDSDFVCGLVLARSGPARWGG
jgi:hypothetical protein